LQQSSSNLQQAVTVNPINATYKHRPKYTLASFLSKFFIFFELRLIVALLRES